MQLSSSLLEKAVASFARLPGIGKKTALRLALHMLKQEQRDVESFCSAILAMREQICFCQRCHNISDDALCSICMNTARNQQVVCVVESIKEVIAIEATQQFNGVYHVLGGVISPLDGIGPDKLNIESLIRRVQEDAITELTFALNPTIQGDTTIYYIQKKINHTHCIVTTIARGVAFGGELEYADELTLAKSLTNRLPIEKIVK